MPNIKGTWQWLDNPALEVPETIDQTVSFNSNGESFERMEVRGFIRYYYAGQHTPEYVDVTATGETWAESGYKYVDFGEAEQAVSDDFYTYFMANAFPYTEIQLGSVYPVTLLTKGSYLDKNIRVLPSPTQEPTLEQKTVTPTTSEQVVTPSQGYDALSQVTVRAVPTETKTVTPTESQQTVTPSEGKFLSDVTVRAIQATEEDIVENGEYTPESGKYYKKVNVNVPQYTDISSTTAQASDVLEGKYFFPYNHAPRTEGTIPERTPSNVQFTSKTDSVTFQEGYYPEASTVKIAESEKAKIIPENIKEGISILGVQGNYAGNGLDINGAINEYVVNAGANVNAGDFVEFITNNTDYFSGTGGLTCACLIDDNKVLVAYYNTTLETIQSFIININENGVTFGAVYTVETSHEIRCLSACAIETDKVFLAYGTTSPLYYGYAKVLQINNEIITAGARTQFHNSMVDLLYLFHAENTNQVLIAYSRKGSTVSARVRVATINDLSITLSDYYDLQSDIRFMGMCKVTANAACLVYIVAGGTIYARIVSIKNGNPAVGASKTTTGVAFVSSPCLLNSTTVLFLWAPQERMTACLFGKIALSDTTSGISVSSISTYANTLVGFGQYNTSSQSPELRQLENGKLLLTYVDGGESLKTKIINGSSLDSQNADCTIYNDFSSYLAPVVLSSTKAIIFYCSDTKTHDFSIIDINGNNITRSRTQNPTYVQPATTRDNYVGVAKTGGTAGQTVEVFEVPFSYTVTVSKTNCTNTAVTSPMKQSETQTITFTANTAYELPETITVTNCEYTWNNLTGELTITNLTGNVQITVNATVQKLAAPVIALNGSQVSWNTVPHATSYGIFANNTPFGASTATTSVDLSQYEKAMGAGVKSITVNAQGSPYATSDMSNAVSYTVTPLAAPSVTFVPTTGQLVWAAIDGADSYTVYEQTSSSQWQEVTTTTATYATIDYSVGTHTMAVAATSTTKVDSDRSAAVTVVCRGINLTLSNVTGASSNPTKMFEGTTETLTFTANSGYTLPDAVSITGATVSWNKDTGTLTLSNPTSNITGTITGVATQTGYTVTVYNGNEPNRTISVTINGQTIKPGTNYTFTNITELVFDDSNTGSDITVKMDATSTTWGVGDYTWTDGFPHTITIDHDGNVAVWAEVF